jgi:ATP-dependent DNA helicase RecQ
MDSAHLFKTWPKVPAALGQMGFSSLRNVQTGPVQSILSLRDTMLVMPTSAGKSAVYIVPSLAAGWRTLVFFPLVSLISDQWKTLREHGIRAGALSGSMTRMELELTMRQWQEGSLQFLLVAPERLRNEQFRSMLYAQRPDLVAVDEAHVMSQWGHNFRESYMEVGPIVEALSPKAVLTMTATMTHEVRDDVASILGLKNYKFIAHYYRRDNLKLTSLETSSLDTLLSKINSYSGPVVVYFSTVTALTKTIQDLSCYVRGGCAAYHGQMQNSQRESTQSAFMNGDVRVMFATNAFGMGVDKRGIEAVIHMHIPGTVDALAQEIGRGGRGDNDCDCITFLNKNGINTQNNFADGGWPLPHEVMAVYNQFYRSLDKKSSISSVDTKTAFEMAGVSTFKARAIMSIMAGKGVTERIKTVKPYRIKILKDHPEPSWSKFIEDCEFVSSEGSAGYKILDVDALAEFCDIGRASVVNKLKSLDESKYVEVVKPPRSQPVKILKGLTKEDLTDLPVRRQKAFDAIKEVVEYCETPDKDKHDFLETYFQNLNEPSK